MGYDFWYDVAEYADKYWKGNFSAREIAQGAYEYLCEWEFTLEECKVTIVIEQLIRQLYGDWCEGNEEAKGLLESILKELEYNGIKLPISGKEN